MAAPGLKLTVFLGDRDRADGALLADALMDLFARERVAMSVLLRGTEGYGLEHQMRTERLLTLSEDLPLLAIAMDGEGRILPLAEQVAELAPRGAIALERVRLLEGGSPAAHPGEAGTGEDLPDVQTQLTVFLARGHRVSGRPAYERAVECMRGHGLYGANMLLGLDGTVGGERKRARFMSRNPAVPSMIVAVGEGAHVAAAVPELREMLRMPMALERVQVCKRDGVQLSMPAPPPVSGDGLDFWQKLTVYTGEQARHGREPLHETLVRRLREADAAGVTTMRGVFGYHGDHDPHGERLLALGRHAPLLTIAIDTPENTLRWFQIVDELTSEVGLVTCENVPALRAATPSLSRGGLRLASADTP
jgi:PII-like signaling protein